MRIFEPFYRSHAHTRFPQGMGLGLTIARDLVVAHEGRLEVESKVGQGSSFTIWLPLPPVTSQHEDASEQPKPMSDESLATPLLNST
jgi:signal transduction histidine kinase